MTSDVIPGRGTLRVVFFGTPEIAVPSLKAVAEHYSLAALVCQPDKPRGRGGQMTPPPTKEWAVSQGFPVVQPTALNDGKFEGWLKEQAPEVCVLAAYGRILKQPILDVPTHGFLNVHPSLLPKYRGPSPIQSAILAGEETTGVTIMRLDAGMDTGDILLQETAAIFPEDTGASLAARLGEMGASLLLRGIESLASGRAVFTPQDHSRATVTKLFEKHDGQIRWGAPARQVHLLVRAAHPWPIAHCLFKGEVCRVHATVVVDEPASAPPGTVVGVEKDRIVVATGDGCLAIVVFQAPGKRAMAMVDYLRGHAMAAGDRFEDL